MKILGSEITPYKTYLNRRKFIKGSLASAMLVTCLLYTSDAADE